MSQSPKFHPIFLYDQPFSRYKVADNQKCTEWPHNNLEHLIIKGTLYTINIYLRGPNFCPLHSTPNYKIQDFRDTRSLKTGNAPNECAEWPKWPQTDFEILPVNSNVYTPSKYPRGPNWGFQDTRLSKSKRSEMHRMISTSPWTLNSQKYLAHKKYLPPRPKVRFFCFMASSFSRYKVVKNRESQKCTEWPQNDCGHVSVKSTVNPVYIKYLPPRPKFWWVWTSHAFTV